VAFSANPIAFVRMLRVLFLLAVVMIVAVRFNSLESGAPSQVRYIAPTPAGRADGSDWANAAPLQDLPKLLSQLAGGGEILLRADAGPYSVPKPIMLGDRQSSAPVTIRGVDPTGQGAAPLLVGRRIKPYSVETADTGRPVFGLMTGANHLTFENLSFENVGNGCFSLAGVVEELTISDVKATNVRRFIENIENGLASTGIDIHRVTIEGFSKQAIRLQNDTHDVLIEDVVADSQRQDGDRFAMGFHLTDTVHDVTFRRVTAMNSWDTVSNYRNGDGFVSERETYGLRFEDTKSVNNMDAGYDIKASHVIFVRAAASGNKRNFRLWGSNIVMTWSKGADPIQRGGGGTQAQVWAGPAARFTIIGSTFAGGDSNTVVFDLENDAVGKANRTTVRRAPGSRLSELADNAQMVLNGRRLD
jgi:hypothetical protein